MSLSQKQKYQLRELKNSDSSNAVNTISCKSQVGAVENKSPLLFTADPLHIPDALSIADTIVISKKGAKCYFQIPVTNKYIKHQYIYKEE